MEVPRTSMIHAVAPHFLWPFAVRYAVAQLNLWPCVSLPETSPTLRWTGEVGDASTFQVWGSLSLVRDLPTGKLSPRTLRCVFRGFPTDAPPWKFYHPGSCRVLSSRNVTFDESICFYRLHPHRSSPVPLWPLSLVDDPPPVASLPPPGPAPSGVPQVDPPPLVEPVEVSSDTSGPVEGDDQTAPDTVAPRRSTRLAVPPGFQPRPSSPPLQPVAVDSGAAGGGDTRGAAGGVSAGGGAGGGGAGGAGAAAGSGGAGAGGASAGVLGVGHAGGTGAGGIGATGGTEGAATVGVAVGSPGSRRQEHLSPERLREWDVRWGSPGGGAGRAGAAGSGGTGTGGTGATGGTGGAGPVGASAAVPRVGGTGGADTGGATGGIRAGDTSTGGTCSGGATGGAGVGGARRQESLSPQQLCEWAVCWGSPGGGAGGAGSGGAVPPGTRGSGFPVAGTTPLLLFPPTDQPQPQLLPGSPLPAPAPHTEVTEFSSERREPETRASTPVHGRRVVCPRAPAVPGTHRMALRPSSVPQRIVLPLPPASSLPHVPDPESHLVRAASPTNTRLLATVVIDPSFESAATSALVAELVDFAVLCHLDYAASLAFESSCPPSVGGELALGCDVLEDRQFELECLAAAAPYLVSTLLFPEGDPDALDIPTPRSYAEAITGPYSSQWQTAMDTEMASWKSTATYVDEVPPPGANIVDGMWIFRVKRPPGSLTAFKPSYVARGFRQGQGVNFFQTFSPTPKMTTLRVLLHVAAQRDYELHSLDFSTTFMRGSLHEAI
ncbi:unnamed protein product [Closterium sp. NIES-54]